MHFILNYMSKQFFHPTPINKGYAGALKGICLVSIAMGVGYGDVTPRTACGKLLTSLCVIFGLLMVSLLMGSLIVTITEADSLDIKDKKVVVLSKSTEEWVTKNKFNCQTVRLETYEDVIQHISDKQNQDTLGNSFSCHTRIVHIILILLVE